MSKQLISLSLTQSILSTSSLAYFRIVAIKQQNRSPHHLDKQIVNFILTDAPPIHKHKGHHTIIYNHPLLETKVT